MHDYYEINVAKNGRHFFATSERSLNYRDDYEKVLKVMLEKFPEIEGYSVTARLNHAYGEPLSIEPDINVRAKEALVAKIKAAIERYGIPSAVYFDNPELIVPGQNTDAKKTHDAMVNMEKMIASAIVQKYQP
jgi:hypothetical protein